MKTEIYLDICLKEFEKHKKEAVDESKSQMGDDYIDGACYKDMIITDATFEFDPNTGKLLTYGRFFKGTDDLGWIETKTVVSLDLALDIINYYMKKLGKLKTVLEATK